MIKPQKNSPRAHLKDLNAQHDTKVTRSPVDLYNTRLRKEGEPILTEDQYTKMMRTMYDRRKKDPGETQFILVDEIEISEEVKRQVEVYTQQKKELKDYISKTVGIPEDMMRKPEKDLQREREENERN